MSKSNVVFYDPARDQRSEAQRARDCKCVSCTLKKYGLVDSERDHRAEVQTPAILEALEVALAFVVLMAGTSLSGFMAQAGAVMLEAGNGDLPGMEMVDRVGQLARGLSDINQCASVLDHLCGVVESWGGSPLTAGAFGQDDRPDADTSSEPIAPLSPADLEELIRGLLGR